MAGTTMTIDYIGAGARNHYKFWPVLGWGTSLFSLENLNSENTDQHDKSG